MPFCAIQRRICHDVWLLSLHGNVTKALICPSLRTVSDSPATGKDLNKPIKHWDLSINPFTKIKCNLGCNVSIKPLDPHCFPEADRAFVNVHRTDPDQDPNVDRFHVCYDPQSSELHISAHGVKCDVSVELTAPVKCDLHVETKDQGNVKIHRMESDRCHVHTENGSCELEALKGHEVLVQSTGGNITGLQTIHGNVEIRASGDSNVDIMKIQGTTMKISTERGLLKVKAIYGESTSLSSASGDIQIGHVHGEAVVQSETGNVGIDSSSGSLKVFTAAGNIDAYVGHDGTAELHTQQGTVSVRVPATIKTGVQLCGRSVNVSSEVTCQETERSSSDGRTTVTAHLNGVFYEERWIRATADEGAVSLRPQSWFETLRLGAES